MGYFVIIRGIDLLAAIEAAEADPFYVKPPIISWAYLIEYATHVLTLITTKYGFLLVLAELVSSYEFGVKFVKTQRNMICRGFFASEYVKIVASWRYEDDIDSSQSKYKLLSFVGTWVFDFLFGKDALYSLCFRTFVLVVFVAVSCQIILFISWFSYRKEMMKK